MTNGDRQRLIEYYAMHNCWIYAYDIPHEGWQTVEDLTYEEAMKYFNESEDRYKRVYIQVHE
jgi:hypothetical protein